MQRGAGRLPLPSRRLPALPGAVGAHRATDLLCLFWAGPDGAPLVSPDGETAHINPARG